MADNRVIHYWTPGVTMEQWKIAAACSAYNFYGVKAQAAKSLGIDRQTIDTLLEKADSDDLKRKDAQKAADLRNEEYLRRARGPHANQAVATATPEMFTHPKRHGAESATNSATEPTVPVPERAEVQTLLPKDTAKAGARKSGGQLPRADG